MFTDSLRLPWQGESTGVSFVKFVSNCETSSSEVSDGSNGGFSLRLMTSDQQMCLKYPCFLMGSASAGPLPNRCDVYKGIILLQNVFFFNLDKYDNLLS